MNLSAASSFSSRRKPAVALPMPVSNISRSWTPKASRSSSFDANQRYSVGRETPACSATSERLSLVWPVRPSASTVAARIRRRVDVSSTDSAPFRLAGNGSFTAGLQAWVRSPDGNRQTHGRGRHTPRSRSQRLLQLRDRVEVVEGCDASLEAFHCDAVLLHAAHSCGDERGNVGVER